MSKKLVIGFIAGAVAGTLTGILLAPAKGSESRSKLAGRMNDCIKRIKRTLTSLDDTVQHADAASDWEHAERPYTAANA